MQVAAYPAARFESRLEMVPEGEILRTDYTLALDGGFYTMTLTAECLEGYCKDSGDTDKYPNRRLKTG